MPTTRAPAGPRRRRAAPGGGRAMHLTPSPTAEVTAVAPWADHERARCRAGRAPPALRRADGASMDRPRPLLRAGDQGRGSLRRPLYVQSEARPHRALAGPSCPPTHRTLYDPRPLGRAASPRTPCGKPRRAVGPNRRFGGEWRAMVYYYMVCDHTTHPTCTATTTPPTPTSLVHTRPAPGFEPRKMPQQPPPPPPERVQVEGAFFALGVSE